MRRKILLCLLFAILVASAIVRPSISQEGATTSVSPLTVTKSVGETFSINITVANVQYIWGYQYVLHYNATLLTALNWTNLAYLSYSPFEIEEYSLINETGGYVGTSLHAPFGDSTGLTTVEPKPLLSITFQVDAEGSCTLEIDKSRTRLVNIYGKGSVPGVNIEVSDGYFSTQEIILHDIAITDITFSATTASPGTAISIDVAVKNKGGFTENFTVLTQYNSSLGVFKEIDTKAGTNLEPNASTTLNFLWDTTDVAEGRYIIRVEATLDDAEDQYALDNTRDTSIITLTKGGGGISPTIIYIVAGIVVVIVVAGVVYVLFFRKK